MAQKAYGSWRLHIEFFSNKIKGERKNMSETNNQSEKPFNWKGNTVIGLRFLQLLALALVAVGFIWGLGDFINSLMPSGQTAPMSLLLILYGLVGSAMIEVPIRVLQRKK